MPSSPYLPLCYPRMMTATQILLSSEAIQRRVREIADAIDRDYASDDTIHFVAILRGCFIFLADLVRALDAHRRVTIDFIAVSSYSKTVCTTGEVRLLKDLDESIEGRHVIIVDDIVDTGLTLTYLQDILGARSPKSLRTVCLLSKPSRRRAVVAVDHIGFTIADRFVVGYGLDYAGMFRNLLHIAALDSPQERP